MPVNVISNVVKTCKKSEKEVEELWDAAKEGAKEKGLSEDTDRFYAYAMGIFKKSVGKDCCTKLGWVSEEFKKAELLLSFLKEV